MQFKEKVLKIIPFLSILCGLFVSLYIYYIDFLKGGGTFGIFGTSLFTTGIYLIIIGIILLSFPHLCRAFVQFIILFLKKFKIILFLIIFYIIISSFLFILGKNIVFFIQLPIF
ncbi:MAG: hypothetical protein ACFFDN_17485, partial [Candidatus Hodarchaeota archaeon]